jgi:hypothetical protein
MSWLFSRALVEAFSEARSLDGEPCAPLSVIPTLHKFYRLDKTMEPSNLSRFGLTCAVLTEGHGEELLTSFLAASRARTSAQPEKVKGLTGPSLVSGLNLHGSLARFDLDSSSWKTPQCSLIEGWDEFSETWPAWGSMRNGVSWGRTMPALPTSENASGFLPTPTATNTKANHMRSGGRPPRTYLPTPMASDCEARGGHRGNLDTLTSFTKAFPTPCARDFRSPNLKPYSERGGGQERGTTRELHRALSNTPSRVQQRWRDRIRRWIECQASSGTGPRGGRSESPSWWAAEPALGRVAHGVAHRVDRLKAIGNGQVPAVVRLAFQTLYRRLVG